MAQAAARLGAWIDQNITRFAVRAPLAEQVWLCLFDQEDREVRYAMQRHGADWVLEMQDNLAGSLYGYRAAGKWAPDAGRWFDSAKLLVDPYAQELDRRFTQDPRIGQFGEDTSDIVPRAIVPETGARTDHNDPVLCHGGLIYELNVRGFTMLHPAVPEAVRGTVAALAHPAVIAHLRALHVTAVELMPIVAWLDERHLPPLGLVNAWGYNPVALMALDPGLCPGGLRELRDTVSALHDAGIGVLLDLVFNHTGESDAQGGTLSLRGLDAAAYATSEDGTLINDTGCGNTLNFANEAVRRLALDTMRHFVRSCGVDGFRFDLAPVLARGPGFSHKAPVFDEIAQDPILSNRVMIAEPWDVGPDGYHLGHFPESWLEWNDRFRDDIRKFWRGDESIAVLATRLAGSSDIFGASGPERDCRSVNFLAAHDGFTLADTVAYIHRHNEANGEGNRDGHGENYSWNHGVEGPSENDVVIQARQADMRALLGMLFASTGTIMLTAGDEFARTQHGNNNAYCQDNLISWVDWSGRDQCLEAYTFQLAAQRAAHRTAFAGLPDAVAWQALDGRAMTVGDWHDPHANALQFTRFSPAEHAKGSYCIRFTVDRCARKTALTITAAD